MSPLAGGAAGEKREATDILTLTVMALLQLVLPAAIFSIPGVPDSDMDDTVVYGYAGAGTIGHEITHGFDDEARQFDRRVDADAERQRENRDGGEGGTSAERAKRVVHVLPDGIARRVPQLQQYGHLAADD